MVYLKISINYLKSVEISWKKQVETLLRHPKNLASRLSGSSLKKTRLAGILMKMSSKWTWNIYGSHSTNNLKRQSLGWRKIFWNGAKRHNYWILLILSVVEWEHLFTHQLVKRKKPCSNLTILSSRANWKEIHLEFSEKTSPMCSVKLILKSTMTVISIMSCWKNIWPKLSKIRKLEKMVSSLIQLGCIYLKGSSNSKKKSKRQ